MSGDPTAPALQVHGWTVFAHPLFLAQLDTLTAQVEAMQRKDPVGYVKKNATKRLAAIRQLAFEVIPQDPTRPEYRRGNTLGDWETLLIEDQRIQRKPRQPPAKQVIHARRRYTLDENLSRR